MNAGGSSGGMCNACARMTKREREIEAECVECGCVKIREHSSVVVVF